MNNLTVSELSKYLHITIVTNSAEHCVIVLEQYALLLLFTSRYTELPGILQISIKQLNGLF